MYLTLLLVISANDFDLRPAHKSYKVPEIGQFSENPDGFFYKGKRD